MRYTANQQKAIDTIDQNLQVIACAGSGKTQVISARIVNILKKKAGSGISPENIVAFTFTKKAAAELKDRIHRICLDELGTDQGLGDMYVGTIHGYCLDLLQSSPLYEYLKFSVLDEVQQRLLIDRYSRLSGLTSVPLLGNPDQTLARWRDSQLYQQLLSILSEGDVEVAQLPSEVLDAYTQYTDLCKSKGYLDYSMIVYEAVTALHDNPAVRERVSSQVRYLTVDEYQDVNPVQEKLIRILSELGANVCVVGDDDQTIYQWRGSDASNMLGFSERYPNVQQISLNENFRSSTGIVSAARQVIERNPERLWKRMESTNAQPHERGSILALAFPDPAQEANWIAEKISILYGTEYKDKPNAPERGLTYSDFAILLRSVRKDGEPIINALSRADIPYVVGGMDNLFETPEVQAMRSVFFYLADFCPKGHCPVMTEELLEGVLANAGLGVSEIDIARGMRFLNERKHQIGTSMKAELYLQRLYLDFLEELGVREEMIDQTAQGSSRNGEIIFYNLGKFSQVISDFEQINFDSTPKNLYRSFANFLHYQAPKYYPEGWEEAAIVRPDAVLVTTVHKSKGMQWPVVFVPCLRKNRFPSKRQGGRSVWHVIPESAVHNAERYKGTVEDERRLFYVALTRAERYLFCSWAPIESNRNQRKVSMFYRELTEDEHVLTREPLLPTLPLRTPKPRREEVSIPLTFSELKYYFICPYQFKLRFLYGFDAPINRAIGYGNSLHDALAEIHAESLRGCIPSASDVPELVQRHLHLPFANKEVENYLRQAAEESLARYLTEHHDELHRLEHVEKVVELKLDEGVVVNGRIDLIRHTDTDEVVIVDFKSDERAQQEDITEMQLHTYAVGYEQLTGKRPDLIEIHNMDRGGARRALVDAQLIEDIMVTITRAGRKLQENDLPRLQEGKDTCSQCEFAGLCRIN